METSSSVYMSLASPDCRWTYWWTSTLRSLRSPRIPSATHLSQPHICYFLHQTGSLFTGKKGVFAGKASGRRSSWHTLGISHNQGPGPRGWGLASGLSISKRVMRPFTLDRFVSSPFFLGTKPESGSAALQFQILHRLGSPEKCPPLDLRLCSTTG